MIETDFFKIVPIVLAISLFFFWRYNFAKNKIVIVMMHTHSNT